MLSLTILIGTLSIVRAQYRTDSDWETKAGGKLSFEVASVKIDDTRRRSSFPLDASDVYASTGGRLSANFPLLTYISFAYKLSTIPEQYQALVARLPKWVAEDSFDIQAKASDSDPTKDQMRLMMQDLLAERFKLAVRLETQEAPVFTLVLAKPGNLGPKLRPHSEGPPCDAPPPPGVFPPTCHPVGMKGGNGRTTAASRDITIPQMAEVLPLMDTQLGRPVVDQTGLSGTFDFTLDWAREIGRISQGVVTTVPADPQGPSFQQALREQLGLKLESTKAPLQILVIDHIERPSEN